MSKIRISTTRLRNGMIIASAVYTLNGVVLYHKGTVVNSEVKEMLAKHFIDFVVVEYQDRKSIREAAADAQKPLVDQKRMEQFQKDFYVAEENLSQEFKNIVNGNKDIDVQSLLGMLNGILQKKDTDVSLCNMLFQMKKTQEGLYNHSLNTALYGQILSKWLHCDKQEEELIAIAGILHDIGFLKLTDQQLEQFTFRDELRSGRYDKHTMAGYQLLKDKDVDHTVKQAVLTHHERMDNSGFPLKVGGSQINKISRIIAIADTYDTLTMNEKRKKILSPFEVLKYLEDTAYNRLDSNMLMTFISQMAQTFIQHEVELSNGWKGKIILINKYALTRPLVQIGNSFIDLTSRNDITITKILD